MNLGYACINSTLSDVKPKKLAVTTNRTMRKATFQKEGIKLSSELALQNVKDLLTIVKWNEANNIKFFRISSEIFPWASEYDILDLPDIQEISKYLKQVGDYCTENNQRLTTQPGPFNKLCSPQENVVKNTVKDLENHGVLFDLMGFEPSHWNKINIHVGASYGGKYDETAKTFCESFDLLSDSVKKRLTVENDDKKSLWSTKRLYEQIYSQINIPIVHDLHHHLFCHDEQPQEEALTLAVSTWGDVKPVVHYSQSRREEHNDQKIKENAHSDSYWILPELYGQNVDVMLECKHKEIGLFKIKQMLGE